MVIFDGFLTPMCRYSELGFSVSGGGSDSPEQLRHLASSGAGQLGAFAAVVFRHPTGRGPQHFFMPRPTSIRNRASELGSALWCDPMPIAARADSRFYATRALPEDSS